MARLFDDAASEYLYRDEAVAGVPFAMVCWFNADTKAAHQILMWLQGSGYHGLRIDASDGQIFAISYKDPTNGEAHSAIITTNTWQHACGIWASATDRRALLNGANKGTNSTNISPSGLNKTLITNSWWTLSGMIAEAAFYDLSVFPGGSNSAKADYFEARILPSLVKGFTPLCYPLGLTAYWPLIRGINDRVGGYNLTADGSVAAPHCRVFQPHGVV